jgi:hypothetical protein
MAKSDLRKFRHDISQLKKRGLISKEVDARSVKPTSHFHKLINRFDDVLSGKATPVKLSKSETKNLKAAGYDVYKGKVLFPHSAGEKISVQKGHAKVRQANGVERVTIPIPYHQLEDYLEKIETNAETIDNMKRDDEYFAFKFYGNRSVSKYGDIGLLLEDLRQYKDTQQAIRSGKARDMSEIYRNLEIVRLKRSTPWYKPPNQEMQRRASKKKPMRQLSLFRQEQRREANRERAQRFRDRMSSTEKAIYKEKGKKRAKKSWKKKHK